MGREEKAPELQLTRNCKTYHVEAGIGIFLGLLTGRAVDTRPLPVILSCLVDRGNGIVELSVHLTIDNRVTDVVTQVEWPDEQNIYARHFGNFIDL